MVYHCRNIQCRYLYFLFSLMYEQVTYSGPDGNRTRVRKPIPCPSTIIVCLFAAGLAPARSLLNPGADTLIHSVAS